MPALKVLSALDAARIQWYHFKAIIVAGMGLFTDAYDLFCIAPIMKMISQIYYHNDPISTAVLSVSYVIALLGTAAGQLIFGYLGDRVGRRRVYGLCLLIMIFSSFGCGFSICTKRRSCVMASLGFFRFVLGLGIGGDYPLSATIMSEFANKRTRGAFIAAVFSMQGLGILMSSAVTMVVCVAFKKGSGDSRGSENTTPWESDIAWRLIVMLGALPAALTFYWRMLMPETARYTALVENNVIQAAKDMERVMSVSISQDTEDTQSYEPALQKPSSSSSSYKLFSRRFFHLHGRDLFAASANWFLVDIVFYTSNLLLSQIFNISSESTNVYDAAFQVSRLAAIVAACSTIPGYWFTVYFIDKVGRVKIQLMGFFFMTIVYIVAGIPYSVYWSTHKTSGKKGFMILYGLVFFFSNFGPNTTTFIIPAELFPARFRSTCHGISGAFGKFGAIVGTVGFLWATKKKSKDDKGPDPKRMMISFLILGGVCICGMFVTYFFTRETMGRSLEENEHEHDNDNDNDDEDVGLEIVRRQIGATSTGSSSSTNELLPTQ